MSDLFDTIVSLSKQRGFIFQSSEIYGGLSATYDYGPLGVELKRNVKERWWQAMEEQPCVLATKQAGDYHIQQYAKYAAGNPTGNTAKDMKRYGQ